MAAAIDGGMRSALRQARRLTDEVLVGHGREHRQAKIGNLTQAARQFQRVEGVLVEVVARVDDDPALRDPMINSQLHTSGEESLDFGRDVAVLRPTVVFPRQCQAVGDHQGRTLGRRHISQLWVVQTRGVVDYGGARRDAAGSDLRSERVDRDDDVPGRGNPLDNGHHAVELLRQTNLRRVRRERYAADIDPTRPGVGGSDRRLDCVLQHIRTTLIEEGIGRTIHDPHYDDLMIEVEPSPTDGPNRMPQRWQVDHGVSLDQSSDTDDGYWDAPFADECRQIVGIVGQQLIARHRQQHK